MKKIVMGIAAVAMASAMFAADPEFAPSLAEYSGNQSVTWGIDLDKDDAKTGFVNNGSATLKFNLFTAGDKTTSGNGDIWAELKIKNDSNDANATMSVPVASVDVAKFHFGPVYVGIQAGDVQIGQLKVTRAIKSADNDNGIVLADVGAAGYTQGIVIGYGDDNFGLDVNFRSDEATQYTDKYAIAAEATLKDSNEFVPGLEVKGGYSYELSDKTAQVMAYAGSVGYKVTVSGDYYVKAAAGYTADNTAANEKGDVAGAVIFGWGDTADANAGVYFLDTDNEKKVTPGVSVSYVKDLDTKDHIGTIEAAFYLGSLVDNLKAAALADFTLVKDVDTPIAVRAGVAYDIKADDITITPKAGLSWKNKNSILVGTDGSLLVKAGVDVTGLINNTTFSAEWVSGELLNDPAKAEKGTLNFTAKIAL